VRTRVGIELTPVASRIVEVVHRGRVWRTPGSGSSVVSFGMCRPRTLTPAMRCSPFAARLRPSALDRWCQLVTNEMMNSVSPRFPGA
jgi:hypothetical protein